MLKINSSEWGVGIVIKSFNIDKLGIHEAMWDTFIENFDCNVFALEVELSIEVKYYLCCDGIWDILLNDKWGDFMLISLFNCQRVKGSKGKL